MNTAQPLRSQGSLGVDYRSKARDSRGLATSERFLFTIQFGFEKFASRKLLKSEWFLIQKLGGYQI